MYRHKGCSLRRTDEGPIHSPIHSRWAGMQDKGANPGADCDEGQMALLACKDSAIFHAVRKPTSDGRFVNSGHSA